MSKRLVPMTDETVMVDAPAAAPVTRETLAEALLAVSRCMRAECGLCPWRIPGAKLGAQMDACDVRMRPVLDAAVADRLLTVSAVRGLAGRD